MAGEETVLKVHRREISEQSTGQSGRYKANVKDTPEKQSSHPSFLLFVSKSQRCLTNVSSFPSLPNKL